MAVGEHNAASQQFLQVGEAARILGVGRLKLREAIAKGVVPARRDNEGHLRVDLDDIPAEFAALISEAKATPEALVDSLFDEIEELQTLLTEREAEGARMADLIARQADALDRAADALEISEKNSERLAGLLERSFELMDAMEAARPSVPTIEPDARLTSVSERAFALLEQTAVELEESRAEGARFAELVGQALELAEATEKTSGEKIAALSGTAERAMLLLQRAVGNTEASQRDAARFNDLVARAMDAGENMECKVAERDKVIADQEGVLKRLFSISERTLGIAVDSHGGKRRGFIGKLMRRSGA